MPKKSKAKYLKISEGDRYSFYQDLSQTTGEIAVRVAQALFGAEWQYGSRTRAMANAKRILHFILGMDCTGMIGVEVNGFVITLTDYPN